MEARQGLDFTKEEMLFVEAAMAHFEDSLTKYKTWIRDKKGVPLPGMDTALAEIQKEILAVRAIQIRIYENCFKP